MKNSLKYLLSQFPYFLNRQPSSNFYKTEKVYNEFLLKDLYESLFRAYKSNHLDKPVLVWREQSQPNEYTIFFEVNVDNIKEVVLYKNNKIFHNITFTEEEEKNKYLYKYDGVSEEVIPVDTFSIHVETYDEYIFNKGIPENHTIKNNLFDQDKGLDKLGKILDTPRRVYKTVDAEDYPKTFPTYCNEPIEQDYYYLQRLTLIAFSYQVLSLPELEILKLLSLNSTIRNREDILCKMFDPTKHVLKYADGSKILDDKGNPIYDEDWQPIKSTVDGILREIEHKDLQCVIGNDKEYSLFVSVDNLSPLFSTKYVNFSFKILNELGQELNEQYIIVPYLNGEAINNEFITSDNWKIKVEELSKVDNPIICFKLFLDKTEMENELETYDGQLIINEDSVISDDFKIIIRGCSDADFYVDAITGEDSNNGSQTSPFKTIQKALDSIEGNKNIIYLKDGIYTTEKTLQVKQSCTILSCNQTSKPVIKSAVNQAFSIPQGKELTLINLKINYQCRDFIIKNSVIKNDNGANLNNYINLNGIPKKPSPTITLNLPETSDIETEVTATGKLSLNEADSSFKIDENTTFTKTDDTIATSFENNTLTITGGQNGSFTSNQSFQSPNGWICSFHYKCTGGTDGGRFGLKSKTSGKFVAIKRQSDGNANNSVDIDSSSNRTPISFQTPPDYDVKIVAENNIIKVYFDDVLKVTANNKEWIGEELQVFYHCWGSSKPKWEITNFKVDITTSEPLPNKKLKIETNNNTYIAVTDGNGEYTANLGFLPAGMQEVKAIFEENDSYCYKSTKKYITIEDVTPIKVNPDLTLSTNKSIASIGESVTFTSTINSDATGKISFKAIKYTETINIGEVNITNGNATITTNTLPTGDYTVIAFYSGDDNYNTKQVSVNVTIKGKIDTSLSINDLGSITLDESKTITATLKDIDGNALSNQTVSFTTTPTLGDVVTGTTNNNGIVTVTLKPTKAINYIITCTFTETDTYKSSTTSKTLTVNKKPSTLSLTTETPIINKGETVKVTGETDATEATGNVTYKIGTRTIGTQPLNSVLKYVSTETNNFIITGTYEGDDKYKPSTNTTNITVKKDTILSLTCNTSSCYIDDTLLLTATLKDSNNNLMEGVNITFKIGNTLLSTAQTDNNGVAKITYKTLPSDTGETTFSAYYYPSTSEYNGSSNNVKITIKKIPTTVTLTADTNPKTNSTNTITATIKDKNGNNTVMDTIWYRDGTQIATKTGYNISHDEVTQYGNHTYKVTAKETSKYEGSEATIKITGKEINTALSCINTGTFYQSHKLRINLSDEYGNALTNKTVHIKWNTITYDKTTDNNGVAELTISTAPGTYVYEASFDKTAPYNSSSIKEVMTVNGPISVTKTANNFAQACSGNNCKHWDGLTSTNLSGNEPNYYATCNSIASKTGTYNTPMYVDCRGFGFNIPANAKITKIKHHWVGRLTSNTANPQFNIKFFNYINQNGQDIVSSQATDTIAKTAGTNWQTFIKEVNPQSLTPKMINSGNFAGRVEYGTNQTTNTGAIYWTYYHCEVFYIPAQVFYNPA